MLKEDISDAEVKIDGFTIFRGDRNSRNRGGTAIYLRDDLKAKFAHKFCNKVVQYVIVKVKKLDLIII